jgi:hypothetical protein
MTNLLIYTGLIIAAALVTALLVLSERKKTRVYDITAADLYQAMRGK